MEAIDEVPEGDYETETVEVPKDAMRAIRVLGDWHESDTGEELTDGEVVYKAVKFLKKANPDVGAHTVQKLDPIALGAIQTAWERYRAVIEEEKDDMGPRQVDMLEGMIGRYSTAISGIERKAYNEGVISEEYLVEYEPDDTGSE